MKLKLNHRPEVLALALLLAGGFSAAAAQSGNVPGDTDYSRFSAFITQRNIFDPNRYPHQVYTSHRHTSTHAHSNSSPLFTLVGTMNYEKGRFAFFSGNGYDLKKILETNGVIAGYSVTEITTGGVKMKGPDTNTITLNLGDQMRQENNGWQLVVQGDAAVGQGTGGAAPATAGTSGSPAATDAAPAPSANVSNNDVLKRLMELRQKANQ